MLVALAPNFGLGLIIINIASVSMKNSNLYIPQMYFHAHFAQEGHNGIADWSFTLIDQGCNLNSVRRKETYWQNVLKGT